MAAAPNDEDPMFIRFLKVSNQTSKLRSPTEGQNLKDMHNRSRPICKPLGTVEGEDMYLLCRRTSPQSSVE